VVTVVIRMVTWPLSRKQLISSRRMQALAPELAEIRRKYKGDRNRQQQAQMELYQERGINPLSGCLPTLISYVLLLPMYYVFSSGLLAHDISSMLTVLGHQLIAIPCQDAANALVPCIQTHIGWLGGVDASKPSVLFDIPGIGLGISALAIVSALLQLVASRMIMPPPTDESGRAMQTTFLILPLIFVFYGSFLPAGLFIYYITTTIIQMVQQYLTVGWGSLFPLFGWTPAFAVGHTPRFGVQADTQPRPGLTPARPPVRREPADRAAGTIRPSRERARTSRRGRRR
jgi:YidC/Oxa1 family membrane protein insertase